MIRKPWAVLIDSPGPSLWAQAWARFAMVHRDRRDLPPRLAAQTRAFYLFEKAEIARRAEEHD